MKFGLGSLDVRIHPPFTPEFDALLSTYGSQLPTGQTYYAGMVNQPFGLPAMVHVEHQITGTSKLQFIDMPARTLEECAGMLSRVCEADPFSLSVVRLHLGCDVPGVPVSWFRNAMRVQYRQNSEVFGRVTNEGIQKGVQTLYFGAKQNGVTVYDKLAERRNDYKARKRQATKIGGHLEPFETLYGLAENAVLTRIERKYTNGKIPAELSTVGLLMENASTFDPFTNIIFCPEATEDPRIEDLGLKRYRKIVTWMWDVKKLGMQGAYKQLKRYSHGNDTREFNDIREWLAGAGEMLVTKDKLLGLYCAGIERQLEVTA